jgi:serine protease Do
VPIKVMRDKAEKSLTITVEELDLENESTRTARRENDDPDVSENAGFGLSIGVLTSDMARRLRVPSGTEGVVVTDVEIGSPAQRAGVSRGDVILQVNRRSVTSPGDADRALDQVPSGGTAFLLILRNGQQNFVTVRKE